MDIDTLLQGYRDAVTVRRIYGDPVERNGVTVVPAAALIGGTGEARMMRARPAEVSACLAAPSARG